VHCRRFDAGSDDSRASGIAASRQIEAMLLHCCTAIDETAANAKQTRSFSAFVAPGGYTIPPS
jgi:hypothetical protein